MEPELRRLAEEIIDTVVDYIEADNWLPIETELAFTDYETIVKLVADAIEDYCNRRLENENCK